MKALCRLCHRRVVEDSIFCEHHRTQAATFSLVFGQPSDTPPDEAPPQEVPTDTEPDASAPGVPSPEASARSQELQASGAPAAIGSGPLHGPPLPEATASPRNSAAQQDPPQLDQDEEQAILAAAVHRAFGRLRSRQQEAAEPGQWPQLSIYFLGDTLHCRAYFSILSASNSGAAPVSEYSLEESCVLEAVASGGLVFEELCQHFREHIQALRTQQINALHLHFFTYAGLIAINVQGQDHDQRNLGAFALDGDRFRKVALEGQVRARMGHIRWERRWGKCPRN